MNVVKIIDLFLFAYQICSDVENMLLSEISGSHDGILNIHEFISHECRRIHRRSHENSPNY